MSIPGVSPASLQAPLPAELDAQAGMSWTFIYGQMVQAKSVQDSSRSSGDDEAKKSMNMDIS